MKNKRWLVVVMLCALLALTACGNSSTPEDTPDDGAADQTTGAPKEDTSDDGEDDAADDAPIDDTASDDSDLEGAALLTSISAKRPERLEVAFEMNAFGMTTKMKTVYSGADSRTEVQVPEMGTSVLIHLAEEGVMYQYVEGTGTGVKMTGATVDYAEEMGLMMDTGMLDELSEEMPEDLVARTETLDGEPVVYIEATETDEEMGAVRVKMWYSEKYAMPLQYEVIVGETTMASLKVTSINEGASVDAALFEPPADIVFETMDMESMMGDW